MELVIDLVCWGHYAEPEPVLDVIDFRRLCYEKALTLIQNNDVSRLQTLFNPNTPPPVEFYFNLDTIFDKVFKNPQHPFTDCEPEDLGHFETLAFLPKNYQKQPEIKSIFIHPVHPLNPDIPKFPFAEINNNKYLTDWDRLTFDFIQLKKMSLENRLSTYLLHIMIVEAYLAKNTLEDLSFCMSDCGLDEHEVALFRGEYTYLFEAICGRKLNYSQGPILRGDFYEEHFDFIIYAKKLLQKFSFTNLNKRDLLSDISGYHTPTGRSILIEAIDCYDKNPEILRCLIKQGLSPFSYDINAQQMSAVAYAIQHHQWNVIDDMIHQMGDSAFLNALKKALSTTQMIKENPLRHEIISPERDHWKEIKTLHAKTKHCAEDLFSFWMKEGTSLAKKGDFQTSIKYFKLANELYPTKLYVLLPLIQACKNEAETLESLEESEKYLKEGFKYLEEVSMLLKTNRLNSSRHQSKSVEGGYYEDAANETAFNHISDKTGNVYKEIPALFKALTDTQIHSLNKALFKQVQRVFHSEAVPASTFDELLKKGADINLQDKNLNTLLHMTIKDRRFPGLIDYFIKNGADLMLMNQQGEIPAVLLTHGNFNDDLKKAAFKSLDTALIDAALNNDIKKIELLIDCGASIHPATTYTPLVAASARGNLETVKKLLEWGAYSKTQAEKDFTESLKRAFQNDRENVFNYLLTKISAQNFSSHSMQKLIDSIYIKIQSNEMKPRPNYIKLLTQTKERLEKEERKICGVLAARFNFFNSFSNDILNMLPQNNMLTNIVRTGMTLFGNTHTPPTHPSQKPTYSKPFEPFTAPSAPTADNENTPNLK